MILETNKLKKLVPYIGTLFVICGYFKLTIYYYNFNIRISDYLEFSEIITLFLNDAVKYSSLILIGFLINFISSTEYSSRKVANEQYEALNDDKAMKRLKTFLKLHSNLLFTLFLLLAFTLIAYFLNIDSFFYFKIVFYIIIALLASMYLINEFHRKYKITYGNEIDPTYLNLILTLNLFLIYIITSSFIDIKKTEENNNSQIAFIYNEKKISSNKNILYVGETKNYLFLHNKKNNSTLIFPRKDISEVQIKVKK